MSARDNRKPFLVNPDTEDKWDYTLSLVKLAGKKIVDIEGHIDTEGDPVFGISKVVFDDGSYLWAEGEHDRPYLYDYTGGTIYKVNLYDLVDENEYEDEGNI